MTSETIVLRLTLFGRSYCHLCDDMLQALAPLQQALGFEVDWIDVDSDEDLEARYGELVPVLAHGDNALCHYFLDEAAVRAYVSGFR